MLLDAHIERKIKENDRDRQRDDNHRFILNLMDIYK